MCSFSFFSSERNFRETSAAHFHRVNPALRAERLTERHTFKEIPDAISSKVYRSAVVGDVSALTEHRWQSGLFCNLALSTLPFYPRPSLLTSPSLSFSRVVIWRDGNGRTPTLPTPLFFFCLNPVPVRQPQPCTPGEHREHSWTAITIATA